jgi:16S rRNA (cytosine1402-N4)-methyltransferase
MVKVARAGDLQTTAQLARLIQEASGSGKAWRLHPKAGQWNLHPAARTFQALRMLVNRELANLQALLRFMPEVLRPGGTAAIISFHSGEDRVVKAAFREGLRAGLYAEVANEPIRAGQTERLTNPRSRSAKLRWARRAM